MSWHFDLCWNRIFVGLHASFDITNYFKIKFFGTDFREQILRQQSSRLLRDNNGLKTI